MRKQFLKFCCLFVFLMTPALAYAELGLVAGAKVGAGLGQPFGPFGASFVPELEVGYLLPALEVDLVPFLAFTYAAPRTRAEVPADERLPGDGIMSYDIVSEQFVLTLGARYFLPLKIDPLSPYIAAGPRLYLMRTRVKAEAGGENFGYNQEADTRVGLHLATGAELPLGPGAALLELGLGYAKIDGYVLRETNAASLNLALGYRFIF